MNISAPFGIMISNQEEFVKWIMIYLMTQLKFNFIITATMLILA